MSSDKVAALLISASMALLLVTMLVIIANKGILYMRHSRGINSLKISNLLTHEVEEAEVRK